MASSSEKTLPSSDSKEENKITSPAHNSNALDSPGMANLVSFIKEDPGFIQLSEELRRSIPIAWLQGDNPEIEFDQEQFIKSMRQALVGKMRQRLGNYLLQNPQMSPSLETLANPGASEQSAECMAQMKKDPELIPILAEIDARGPAALLKLLKKLGKAMGDVEGLNEDELVSQGIKALEIACGYAKMRCAKALLDARAKNRKKKTSLHYATKCGRKKRVSLLLEKDSAVALQNMESKTPIELATTSSM